MYTSCFSFFPFLFFLFLLFPHSSFLFSSFFHSGFFFPERSRGHRGSRRVATLSSNLRRSKHLASFTFVENEQKLREQKLVPLEDRLQSYERIIANAAGRGDHEDENDVRASCRRELRSAIEAVKAHTLRQMDHLNDTSLRDTDDGVDNNDNNVMKTADSTFPHEDAMRHLLQSYSRKTILDALICEALDGVQKMREEGFKAQHLGTSDTSRINRYFRSLLLNVFHVFVSFFKCVLVSLWAGCGKLKSFYLFLRFNIFDKKFLAFFV